MRSQLVTQKLGKVWILVSACTLAAVAVSIALLSLYSLLPAQYISGPGGSEGEVFNVDFLDPVYWWPTFLTLLLFNTFHAMLRWKLVIWQWGVVSSGVSIIDIETWVVMSINETLASTLGIASLFFGALNIYFLLATAFGRTVGVMIIAYLNGKSKNILPVGPLSMVTNSVVQGSDYNRIKN
jgi:hypothetical protein